MSEPRQEPASGVVRTALCCACRSVVPGLLAGLTVMALSGAPRAYLRINLLAFVAPLLLAGTLARRLASMSSGTSAGLAVCALAITGLTLGCEGIDGVRRWLTVGGLRFNPSAVLMPLVLLAVVDQLASRAIRTALLLAVAAQVVLVLQPDAGQACALAAGLLVAATCFGDTRFVERSVLVSIACAGAVGAFVRPDPLPAVPLVEGVIPYAFAMAPGLGAFVLVGLAALVSEPLRVARMANEARTRAGALALAAYLFASCAVVAFGNFPTPVVGYGASPIVGAVLAMAWLGARVSAPKRPRGG